VFWVQELVATTPEFERTRFERVRLRMFEKTSLVIVEGISS
jgi:hypothetical protein